MFVLLVILVVLASILMVLIVLIQNSKGGGLASSFAASNQIMGVRKTTDVLEKATCESSVILNEATQQNATNPTTIPGFGASNTESTAPVAAPVQTPAPDATPAE